MGLSITDSDPKHQFRYVPDLTLWAYASGALGLAAVLATGLRRRFADAATVFLALILALTSVTLYLSGFGGICLDPGDACLISWPARLLPLGAALVALGLCVFVDSHRRDATSPRA